MSDPIERQDVLNLLDSVYQYMGNWLVQYIEEGISSIPPAQPEIIRCRDCKHYYYADNRIPQEQRYTCDLDGDRWTADSYCSYAERRTDDKRRSID